MTYTYYNTGKASVENGQTLITFTDADIGSAEFPTLLPGDLFLDLAQADVPQQRIASIDYAAQTATLAVGWPGTTLVNADYEVRFVGEVRRSTAQTRRYLEMLGQLEQLGIQPNAYGEFSDRSVYDSQPEGFLFLSLNGDAGATTSNWTLYVKLSNASGDWSAGQSMGTGPAGPIGEKGWSPVYASVVDGNRRVFQLVDYVGGGGAKPTESIGDYVGPSGYVSVIANAIDFRGVTGATGPARAMSGTSTTSAAILTGTRGPFTTQSGVGWAVGMRVRIANTANPVNFMDGYIVTYSGTALTVEVDRVGGSGTFSAWTITVSGQPGLQGIPGDQGVPGTGFLWRGAYSAATTYAIRDVVENNGSSWTCITATTGNAPPTLPTTSNAWWQLSARRGTDGSGTVAGVGAGAGIAVNASNPATPVVSLDAPAQTSLGLADTAVQPGDLGTAASANIGTGAGTVAAGNDARFGTVPDNYVTNTKLRDSAAVSVIGRAANSAGDPADIAAAANDTLLRRVSNALGFGQLSAGMVPGGLITFAMLSASGIATPAEFVSGTTGKLLSAEALANEISFSALTDTGTIAWVFSGGNNRNVAIAGNRTLGNISGALPGAGFIVRVTASGATRTLALGGQFVAAIGVEAFPISITTSETVFLVGFIDTASRFVITGVIRT